MDYYGRLEAAERPLYDFLAEEGVIAALRTDRRGPGGIAFAEGTPAWQTGTRLPPPVVVLEPEAYGRLAAIGGAEGGGPSDPRRGGAVEESADGLNVIAELPGGMKKDEVVMLGAHLDSWHGGTGATDNGAGSAVVLEAMRILKALHLPLDRTVRLALWGGEEQAYFGSRAYVREHFADPVTMALRPDHAQLSGYFNLDNGAGKIRGVYLQGNDMMRPLFEAWLSPFRDLGVTTIFEPQHRRNGPPGLRPGGPARLPVHPGPAGLRDPHPPLDPGRLRPRGPRRPHPGLGGDGRLHLPRGQPARAPAAQAVAPAPAAAERVDRSAARI